MLSNEVNLDTQCTSELLHELDPWFSDSAERIELYIESGSFP